MFKVLELKIDLAALPFENLRYRDRTVLILAKDMEGKFVLGAKKDFYPEGIVRMIGGGVDDKEDVSLAAVREIKEEVGISVEPDELTPLLEVKIEGKHEGEIYNHTVFVCFLKLSDQELLEGDDVSEVIRFDETELKQLVNNYFDLSPDYLTGEEGRNFSWGDYGKVYGFIHEKALEEVKTRGL